MQIPAAPVRFRHCRRTARFPEAIAKTFLSPGFHLFGNGLAKKQKKRTDFSCKKTVLSENFFGEEEGFPVSFLFLCIHSRTAKGTDFLKKIYFQVFRLEILKKLDILLVVIVAQRIGFA